LIPVEKGKTMPETRRPSNVYTRAAKSLEEWIRDGIIVQDSKPSVYAYFQEYTVPGTSDRRIRKGFIAAGRIEDYSAGVIFRHEQTLSGPKADRMELCATRKRIRASFSCCTRFGGRVDAMLDVVAHAKTGSGKSATSMTWSIVLWTVTDAQTIESIQCELADKRLVIADGIIATKPLSRTEDECRGRAGRIDASAPYEKVMMTLFNTAGKRSNHFADTPA